MALSTYSALQSAVADWLERSDLTSRIPDFISLAEAQMKRKLRVTRMMARTNRSVAAGYVALPTRFIEVVSITLSDGANQWEPDPAPQAVIDDMSALVGLTGRPRFWAIVGTQIRYFPAPDQAYTEAMTYYVAPEPLSDTVASNWILDEFPDAYLFGALKEAAPFLRDADLLQVFEVKYNAAIEAIADAYRVQVGPLRNAELASLFQGYAGSDLFGSGGGTTPEPDPDPTQDETPNPFFFTAVTDAAGLTTYVSNAIIVAGIDAGVEVDVTIDTGGLAGAKGYSRNGAAYTTNDGFARLNDQFTVRLTTTETALALHEVVLTIGGVSGTFSVRNAATDAYSPSLNFSDGRNSMYLPAIAA